MRPGLAQVRDTQFGVFTGWQVLCEYSRAEMREHIDRGVWVRVFRGVYREAATPPTARLRVEAARLCLAVPSLVAAYGTAARLHGLPVFDDPVTHVLGADPMRSARLIVHPDVAAARDLELIHGTPATGVVRTVVDVARTLSRSAALAVIEAALDRGISRAALFVELDAQRGRRGRVRADELVEIAGGASVSARATQGDELVDSIDAAARSVAPGRPGRPVEVAGAVVEFERSAQSGARSEMEQAVGRTGPMARTDRAARWRTRCVRAGDGGRHRTPVEAGPVAGTGR